MDPRVTGLYGSDATTSYILAYRAIHRNQSAPGGRETTYLTDLTNGSTFVLLRKTILRTQAPCARGRCQDATPPRRCTWPLPLRRPHHIPHRQIDARHQLRLRHLKTPPPVECHIPLRLRLQVTGHAVLVRARQDRL
jgi:hypothetical protein